MIRCVAVRALLACAILLSALLTGCSGNSSRQKYFESGEQYYAQGKYSEAAVQYSNATKADPNFAQAHYKLSQTYIRLRDLNNAFEELNRTVALDPNNYRAHSDLATLLMASRNPEDLKLAKQHLDLLRVKQPNTPETHQAWATYDAAQNDLAGAVKEMEQAITLNPNRSESYVQLALFQLGSNLPEQAEASFKKAVEVDPKAMNAQLALGSFYQSHNRLPEAEQQFKHAMDVDPKSPTPRVALARLLMAEGKSTEIEAFAQQTKKDLPDNPQIYAMLGDFYFASGNLDKAVVEYASLYNDHPQDPLVKKKYIQVLILKSRFDDAGKLNDEILKVNPNDVDSLITRGQVQLGKKDIAGAIDSLQNALRNDPRNADAHYQLGLAFNQQHSQARAESELKEALRLRPNMAEAQRALEAMGKRH